MALLTILLDIPGLTNNSRESFIPVNLPPIAGGITVTVQGELISTLTGKPHRVDQKDIWIMGQRCSYMLYVDGTIVTGVRLMGTNEADVLAFHWRYLGEDDSVKIQPGVSLVTKLRKRILSTYQIYKRLSRTYSPVQAKRILSLPPVGTPPPLLERHHLIKDSTHDEQY